MGSDDLFKKRKADRKSRKYEYRKPKANSFLIVTEGERTEPSYFTGIAKLIKDTVGGNVDVEPTVKIEGTGYSTSKLLEQTDYLVKNSKIIYQNIWLVFDKDDFDDFDKAIQEAQKRGYRVAWSNQSFEYWLFLHFYFSDSALHRGDWLKKLDELFEQYHIGDGRYRKNDDAIYEKVSSFGNVLTAIGNAKRRMKKFDLKTCKPSECDPGTTVHELVESLHKYIED